MLTGEYEHTMDPKGRVFLPAKFRDELGENVMLTRGVDGQLLLHSQPAWQELADKMSQTNQSDVDVRMVGLFGVFAVTECQQDKQGRILIPSGLRRFAKLANDIVIVGYGRHVEIWDIAVWETAQGRYRENGPQICETLKGIGVSFPA